MIFPADPKKREIFQSPGYSWIPNKRWVNPNRRSIIIKPHEEKDITVAVKIPKKREHYNRNWEAILFIESKEVPSGFARIQIKTEKMKKE